MSRSSTNDINVTPLIDVLLVLLVIFLVMMPSLFRSEKVQLPPEDPGGPPPELKVIAMKLHADLAVTFDDDERVEPSEVVTTLRSRIAPKTVVFLDADDGVPWGELVGLVDHVHGLGREEIRVAMKIRGTQPP
jgi:biopolymer transport protein TolR